MKFIMLNNTIYEVLTPTGFQTFDGILESDHTKYLSITIGDDTLKCSLNHIIVNEGKNILASDIKLGDTVNGSLVTICQLIEDDIKMYDLVNVHNGHLYLANNVINHNCDCDFSTSGNTVVSPDLIAYYNQNYVKDPIEKRGFDGNLWVWEVPDYSKNYIVSADVARGDSEDYSAFHVIDVVNCTQVAEYKGQLTTKDFGNMLVAIATEYNDALLVVENANIGWATLQQIIDRGYKNLYYSYKDDVLDSDKFLLRGYDLSVKSNMVAGFTMSSKTRPLAISKMELYIREKSCIIYSKRLVEELSVFIWKNSKAEAAAGYNDDLIMSFCEGLWVRDTALKLRQAGIEINKAALSNMRSTATVYKPSEANNAWKMKLNSNENEDISWLI